MILARMTSKYGAVYRAATASRYSCSSSESRIVYGLRLGIDLPCRKGQHYRDPGPPVALGGTSRGGRVAQPAHPPAGGVAEIMTRRQRHRREPRQEVLHHPRQVGHLGHLVGDEGYGAGLKAPIREEHAPVPPGEQTFSVRRLATVMRLAPDRQRIVPRLQRDRVAGGSGSQNQHAAAAGPVIHHGAAALVPDLGADLLGEGDTVEEARGVARRKLR